MSKTNDFRIEQKIPTSKELNVSAYEIKRVGKLTILCEELKKKTDDILQRIEEGKSIEKSELANLYDEGFFKGIYELNSILQIFCKSTSLDENIIQTKGIDVYNSLKEAQKYLNYVGPFALRLKECYSEVQPTIYIYGRFKTINQQLQGLLKKRSIDKDEVDKFENDLNEIVTEYQGKKYRENVFSYQKSYRIQNNGSACDYEINMINECDKVLEEAKKFIKCIRECGYDIKLAKKTLASNQK